MSSHKAPRDQIRSRRWHQSIQDRKYAFLFITLIGFLLFLPLANDTIGMLWPLLFFWMLYSTLAALDLSTNVFRLAVGLGVLAVGFHMVLLWTDVNVVRGDILEFLIVLLYFLFIAACIVVFLKHIFTEQNVTADTIKGGIAVYFLGGLAFAFLFELIIVVQPGAFSLQGNDLRLSELVYHSFVTLTTLGYGDITPKTEFARTIAYMEAALGQVYIAVLVARLVGMLGAGSGSGGEDKS